MLARRSAALVLAALLSTPAVLAQGASGKVFGRYTGPMRSVTLDLESGTITPGPVTGTRAASTISDFPNLDLAGFVGVDTGAGACQWVDAGAKGSSTNRSDLVTSVVFAYCSAQLTPASGGPGGAVSLGFYEGYPSGGPAPAPSTGVGLFTLAGLPANTVSSSFFRGFRCYFMTVNFGQMLAFADGPIGYSWTFEDTGTDGILAGTWPFLSCVQSCSGPGPDGLGMDDSLDQYCPPGSALRNRFSFGTTPLGDYFTSLSMDIRERTDIESVATSWNGDGSNLDVLAAPAMVLGEPWTPGVTVNDVHQAAGNAPMSLVVRTTCINGNNVTSPIGGRPIEVLVSGALGLRLVATHGPQGTTSAFAAFLVPHEGNLIGVHWAAQATVIGGGFADLSTARCGSVGTVDLVTDP